jgi:hypothetical protein
MASRFSARPGESAKNEQDWVASAAVGPGKAGSEQAVAPSQAEPSPQAKVLDPKAAPTKAFNLRLNDYELELLRTVAEAEFCSQQAVAKRILVRALEQAVKALK